MRLRLVIAALFASALSLSWAWAQQGVSRASLIPGWTTGDGTHMIGVRIDLAPGWKTYWRAPGGNGIPPQFDFSGSRNLARAGVTWPSPEVFAAGGVEAIGYTGSVIFPVAIEQAAPGPVDLTLDLFYGVCEEVCIPVQEQLSLSLPSNDRSGESAIRASLDTMAKPGSAIGMTSARCSVAPAGDDFAMTAVLSFRNGVVRPDAIVFETGTEDIYIDPVAETITGQDLTIDANVYNWGGGPLALDRSALRITVLTPNGAVEVRGCPAG